MPAISLTPSTTLGWYLEAVVIRTGPSAQIGRLALALEGTTVVRGGSTSTPAADLTGAVQVLVTGQGVADNDIVQTLMIVELIG
jgi:hypothetical protein